MKKWYFLSIVLILAVVGGVLIASASNRTKTQKELSPADTVKHDAVAPLSKPLQDEKAVVILTYHSIGPKPLKKETAMQLHYRVTPENFEKQMQYLKDNGYTPITFDALVNHFATGSDLPAKPIVLTFDDGWKDQYDYAVPIIKKFGFTGTFFIISKMRSGGYMSWDDLKALHAGGFEIASHTETHPKLTKATDAQLVQELVGSKKALEDKLGIAITTLAYPYYDHDARVMKAVQDAGYLGARAGWGKFSNDKDHLFELASQEIVNNPNPFSSKRLPD